METKANYFVVGLFTLLAFFAIIAFAVWSASKATKGDFDLYAIDFKGSVSGLSQGNDVRLNGIKVGAVQAIRIDMEDPNLVHVVISVTRNTPIRRDSEASLEIQGITGMAHIAISGGTKEAPILTALPGEPYPRIKSRTSSLAAIMEEAPDLISATNALVHQASRVFSDNNVKNLRDTLNSLAVISKTLEERTVLLEETMENIARASHRLDSTLATVEGLLKKMEPGLTRFTNSGLDEVQRMIAEGRSLIRHADGLVQKINNDPRRFLFGDNLPEYKAK